MGRLGFGRGRRDPGWPMQAGVSTGFPRDASRRRGRLSGPSGADSTAFADDFDPRGGRKKNSAPRTIATRLTAMLAWLESVLRV